MAIIRPKTEHHIVTVLYSEHDPTVKALMSLTFKFGLLQHLDLSDKHVMEGVDGLTCLLDVLANAVGDPENKQPLTCGLIKHLHSESNYMTTRVYTNLT